MLERMDLRHVLQQIADAQPTTFVIEDLERRPVLAGRTRAAPPERSPEGAVVRDDGTRRTPLVDGDGTVVAVLHQSCETDDESVLRERLERKTDALARGERHLHALDGALHRLLGERALAPLLESVVELVAAHAGAARAEVWMLHETGDYLELAATAGHREDAGGDALDGSRLARGEGPAGLAWASGTTRRDEPAADGTHRTPCAVPMFDEHGLFAVVTGHAANVPAPETSGTKRVDVALLERLAAVAATAIANARHVEATRGELARARAMSELGRLLSGATDPADDLDAVCRTLLDALDVTRASVYLVDAADTLTPSTAWRTSPDGPIRDGLVPLDVVPETFCQWCHDNALPAETFRDRDDPRETPRVYAARRAIGVGAAYCMPILRGGESLGAIVVGRSPERRNLRQGEIHAFETIVSQLSAALERHELTSALQHQAHHDALTRLPNRRRFESELEATLADPATHGASGAVLFLDLDGFKLVNDTLGHAVGDALLRQVGERLGRQLDTRDVLARMGGDEFAVIVRDPGGRGRVLEIAHRLSSALSGTFDIDGARLRIGTSVGIAHYPEDAANADELLRQADVAMYQAKHEGKGNIRSFDQTLGSASSRRAELELELRQAIERGQFALVYQPQVSCRDGRVVGVEALIRWNHPERGTISPLEFVPIAEEAGLINTIGAWVLDEAVRQLAAWRNTPLAGLRMSVNIAASQFLLENFAEQVLATLERHDATPGQLELEVTESVVMQSLDAVVGRLNVLRSAGVRIAIDDFGTGYSSLSYLQDLPLDVLKIDRAFVTRLQDERGGHSLVNTILLLATGLGLETVAEGVETPEQRHEVTALGCDLIQGYHFSRPVAPEALADVIGDIHAMASSSPEHARAA